MYVIQTQHLLWQGGAKHLTYMNLKLNEVIKLNNLRIQQFKNKIYIKIRITMSSVSG